MEENKPIGGYSVDQNKKQPSLADFLTYMKMQGGQPIMDARNLARGDSSASVMSPQMGGSSELGKQQADEMYQQYQANPSQGNDPGFSSGQYPQGGLQPKGNIAPGFGQLAPNAGDTKFGMPRQPTGAMPGTMNLGQPQGTTANQAPAKSRQEWLKSILEQMRSRGGR